MLAWGHAARAEKRRIVADPPDCLLTTPESLEAILVSTKIDHRQFFRYVQAVVIDELHAFAGDDRGWHLLSVLSRIQTLGGTGHPTDRVVGNGRQSSRDAGMAVLLGPIGTREVVQPPPSDRQSPGCADRLRGITGQCRQGHPPLHQGEKRLVFCDSRSRVEQLALLLREREVETFVSHSSLGVDERRLAEQAFAQRQNCVIVATSSLELGIDVGDLDRVIQIDAPATVSSFLQRMGRTGRREGTTSNCLFLATSDEGLLRAAALLDLGGMASSSPSMPRPSRATSSPSS